VWNGPAVNSIFCIPSAGETRRAISDNVPRPAASRPSRAAADQYVIVSGGQLDIFLVVARARSSSCIARVGMMVIVSPETCPPTDWRRLPVVPSVGRRWPRPSALTRSIRPARRPRRIGCSRCPWRDRSANHLAEESRRQFVILLLLEGHDIGKLVRVFRGKLELAALTREPSAFRPSLSRSNFSSELSARILPNRSRGRTTLPGDSIEKPGTSMRIPLPSRCPSGLPPPSSLRA